MKSIDLLYSEMEEPKRSAVLAIRDLIVGWDPAFTEHVKYGLPFIYFKGKMFCYFWQDKKTAIPYIGFSNGFKFDHYSLKSDGRKRIKVFEFDPESDLDFESLTEVLKLAMQTYS